ncbi:MAG: hypothetical protein PVF33_06740, partial [Candidatus Latescibacterota bacterium]
AGFADALAGRGYVIRERDNERIVFDPAQDHELREFWKLAAERGAEVRTLGRDVPSLESAVVKAMEHNRGR